MTGKGFQKTDWLSCFYFFKKTLFRGSFNIRGYTFIEDNCQKFLLYIPTVHFSLKNTMFNMEQKVISKIRIIFPEISENFCRWFLMKTPNKGASREMDKHTDVIPQDLYFVGPKKSLGKFFEKNLLLRVFLGNKGPKWAQTKLFPVLLKINSYNQGNYHIITSCKKLKI